MLRFNRRNSLPLNKSKGAPRGAVRTRGIGERAQRWGALGVTPRVWPRPSSPALRRRSVGQGGRRYGHVASSARPRPRACIPAAPCPDASRERWSQPGLAPRAARARRQLPSNVCLERVLMTVFRIVASTVRSGLHRGASSGADGGASSGTNGGAKSGARPRDAGQTLHIRAETAAMLSTLCTRLGTIGLRPNILVTIAALGDPCLQS